MILRWRVRLRVRVSLFFVFFIKVGFARALSTEEAPKKQEEEEAPRSRLTRGAGGGGRRCFGFVHLCSRDSISFLVKVEGLNFV